MKCPEPQDALEIVLNNWAEIRLKEAETMLPKRKPTEVEIQRAMIIVKWFIAWNKSTGPCPINISSEYWGKKLCALAEWIAVLESDLMERAKL
jgi:hypothetical protein